ncbi:MAG TPA: restriction endonuclease subunit S [Actinobacteria bacterium]|nr:restriction endonuclease subunit S [Actinomycetota bacterium]
MNTMIVEVALADVASFLNGGTPSRSNPEYFEGTIPWITGADILADSSIVSNARSHITREAIARSAANLVPAGTVLLVTRTGVGKAAIAGVDLAYSQDITAIVHDEDKITPAYLLRCLKYMAPRFKALAQGATIQGITREVVEETLIPLPPIEEQRRIAAVLEAADALRAKRRQAIVKLDSLTQAIFIDMFGDPISNERRWPEFQLSEICTKIQIGPFGSLLHKSDYVEGGVPLVNPMHLIDGQIQPQPDQTVGKDKYAKLQQYQLERGDVVMARRGEMGRVAIVDAKADGYLCGSGSLYFRPDTEQVIPEFLAAALSSPRGRRELENSSLGVTMPNLNSTIVEQFELGLPPIALQRSFSTALQERSRMHQLQWDQSGVLDALFGSLQQRAFRGEL